MRDIRQISTAIDRVNYKVLLGANIKYPIGNMSMCEMADGNFLCSIRQFNYRISGEGRKKKYLRFSKVSAERDNFFFLADRNLAFLAKVACRIPEVSAMEDLRLVRTGDNAVQISGTYNPTGKFSYIKPFCMNCKYVPSRRSLSGEGMVPFPFVCQKNFVPVQGRPGLFVSDMLDGKIMTVSADSPKDKVESACPGCIPARGSTQLIRYGGRLVGITHERRNKNSFYNRLVSFSEDLSSCAVSDEFTAFSDLDCVNFTCGIHIAEDGLCTVPFTVNDSQNFICRFNWDDACKTLNLKEP